MDRFNEISLEDYSPNINDIADQMYLGPQGQILEALNNFNVNYTNFNGNLQARYNNGRELLEPIEITKKFRWKPGTYAKVKQMYEHYVLRWQVRPSGVSSIFHRRREYHHRELQRQLVEVENLMKNRRADGAVWTEDSGKVVEDFNQFKVDLITKLEELNTYCSQFPEAPIFTIKIVEPDGVNDDCYKIRKTALTLEIYWNRLDINVRNSDREMLQVLPGHKTSIRLRINLLKWFNNYHGANQDWSKMPVRFGSRGQQNITIAGKLESSIDGIAHPYIGSRSFHTNSGWGSVCTGDFQDGITESLSQGLFNPMYDLVMMWMGEYIIGYTGPLNNINYMHIGAPKDWNPEYAKAAGIRTGWCSDTVHRMNISNLSINSHEYCKKIECQMMDECSGFKRAEERKQAIIDIVPEILHISEAKEPRNLVDVSTMYETLQNIVRNDDDLEFRYYELGNADWQYIIRNNREDIITKYMRLPEDWCDIDVNRTKQVISDADIADDMLTWAIARDPNIAFPRSIRPLPHAPHNTRDTTIEVVDLVETPIQSDMEHEAEIVNNDNPF